MGSSLECVQYDGVGLAKMVRRGQVAASELVEEAIHRIEDHNPQINAVIFPMYDSARKRAENPIGGPLSGIPFLLKDLGVSYADVPATAGSRLFRNHRPRYNCELVRRFRAAGLVVLGKTNTPELGLSSVTEPELFGPCNNPWDLRKTPGGSSGGSAAAVASRMVLLAHGNDGGGSIRIPASCCGVFGLKPSRGRNPSGPDAGMHWQGMACDHVLTLSVRDSAAVLDATAGADPGAPHWAPSNPRPFFSEVGESPGKLRIAYTSHPLLPADVHADCRNGLDETVALCRWLGHELTEAVPAIDGEEFVRAFITVVSGETAAGLNEARSKIGNWSHIERNVERNTWAIGKLGRWFSAADFSHATHALEQTGRQMAKFFENFDILLTPTLAMPPIDKGFFRKVQYPEPESIDSLEDIGHLMSFRFTPFTPPFNASGQPAMSVPVHWNSQGLPIGMQFAGRYGDEATLLRLASQLEEVTPWFDRMPPTHF